MVVVVFCFFLRKKSSFAIAMFVLSIIYLSVQSFSVNVNIFGVVVFLKLLFSSLLKYFGGAFLCACCGFYVNTILTWWYAKTNMRPSKRVRAREKARTDVLVFVLNVYSKSTMELNAIEIQFLHFFFSSTLLALFHLSHYSIPVEFRDWYCKRTRANLHCMFLQCAQYVKITSLTIEFNLPNRQWD